MVNADLIIQPEPDEGRDGLAIWLYAQLSEQSEQASIDIEATMASYIAQFPEDSERIHRIFTQMSTYARLMPTVLTASYLQDTQEPTAEEGIKRLAVQVEDHSVDYMDFEGIIEEGYGAGKVEIWDSGYWEPESVKEKKIVAIIHGKKLKGRFTILNFKEKNWLFFKA